MDLFDIAAGDAKAYQLKEINENEGVNSAAATHTHVSPVHTREVPQTNLVCSWSTLSIVITCARLKIPC
jgi:hypothetical protein